MNYIYLLTIHYTLTRINWYLIIKNILPLYLHILIFRGNYYTYYLTTFIEELNYFPYNNTYMYKYIKLYEFSGEVIQDTFSRNYL